MWTRAKLARRPAHAASTRADEREYNNMEPRLTFFCLLALVLTNNAKLNHRSHQP